MHTFFKSIFTLDNYTCIIIIKNYNNCLGAYLHVAMAPAIYACARIIIGASLSEPLLDELAGAMFWYNIYVYIYIYIFVSMGSPFGPA